MQTNAQNLIQIK